jgi:F0F1-type ATP synthase gamma subunit
VKFDKIVESAIQEAIARGEFENLPGTGKPIDLTEYFNAPEEVRVAQAMLKNAGMVPLEVDLLQEIVALKEMIHSLHDDGMKAMKSAKKQATDILRKVTFAISKKSNCSTHNIFGPPGKKKQIVLNLHR